MTKSDVRGVQCFITADFNQISFRIHSWLTSLSWLKFYICNMCIDYTVKEESQRR
jgi:hypothetical protein